MAASPRWKVYSDQGEYLAGCWYLMDAAALAAARGEGTTIRDGHRRIVWWEGKESFPASESYDLVAKLAFRRRARIWTAIGVDSGDLPAWNEKQASPQAKA